MGASPSSGSMILEGRQVGYQSKQRDNNDGCGIRCAALREDSGELIAGFEDGTLASYDLQTGHQLSVWKGHSDEGVMAMSFP